MTKPEVLIGKYLGHYRVLAEIGRGGMGVVYRAVHEQINQRAAAKVLSTRLASNEGHRARFLTEAQASSRVHHEGLVKIFDYGHTADGTPFILMEFLDGESLRTRLQREPGHRLLASDALRLAQQLAGALAAAHAGGIVHRDLKPENIMLVPDSAALGGQRCKVLDFGIATLIDSGVLDLQTPDWDELYPTDGASLGAAVLGTPTYMSPEHFQADHLLDGRCDVYALGIVLYEMLAGQPPFGGEPRRLAWQHVFEEPPSLRRQLPLLSADLSAIIERMLAKAPDDRPSMATVAELLAVHLDDALETESPNRIAPAKTSRSGTWLAITVAMTFFATTVILLAEIFYYLAFGAIWPWPMGMKLIGKAAFEMGSTEAEVDLIYRQAQGGVCRTCERSMYERELPLHKVTVSRFFIDKTEVTNAQFAIWLNLRKTQTIEFDRHVKLNARLVFDLYVGDAKKGDDRNGISFHDNKFAPRPDMGSRPVVQVTWYGASEYCKSQGKRLPTEAEWELAARGPTRRQYPWGEDEPRCRGVAFGRREKPPESPDQPASKQPDDRPCTGQASDAVDVGSMPQDKTPEGVFDLGGNVAEWVEDTFHAPYPTCQGECVDPVMRADAQAPAKSALRIVRGGSWMQEADACRAATRGRVTEDYHAQEVGFRCVRSTPQRKPFLFF